MHIAQHDTNGTLIAPPASVAPGVSHETAAQAMRWPPGTWREITPQEAEELQKPSPEEERAALQKQAADAIQARLDAFARTRGYDGILSAATYAVSANPQFALEGGYCVAARDLTWAKGYEILGAVMAGEREVPTLRELFDELPALVWPDE